MKKLVLVLGLFLNCCIVGPLCYVYEWEHDIDVKTIDEAMEWCANNIEPKRDDTDYWQTPKQTYDYETGDCEDYCILFMQLVFELNYNPELIIIILDNDIQHAVVKIENNYYDIHINKKYNSIEKINNFKEFWEDFSYNETMYYAVTYHCNPAK